MYEVNEWIDWNYNGTKLQFANDWADYDYAVSKGLEPVRLNCIYKHYYGMDFSKFLSEVAVTEEVKDELKGYYEMFSKVNSRVGDDAISYLVTSPIKNFASWPADYLMPTFIDD